MSKPRQKCELCGAVFGIMHDECPECGCAEIYELEDDSLSDDEVFELVEDGIIPNV